MNSTCDGRAEDDWELIDIGDVKENWHEICFEFAFHADNWMCKCRWKLEIVSVPLKQVLVSPHYFVFIRSTELLNGTLKKRFEEMKN